MIPMSNIKTIVGIDNGVTGSIGIITINGADVRSSFGATPVLKVRDFTKEIQYFHRIDWRKLVDIIPKESLVFVERPMVNTKAFIATKSALRAWEATLIVFEMLDIEYTLIDSKAWQREFISSAIIGHDKMKEASKEIGLKLFPSNGNFITKHGDADGLLIAEYARRKFGC